MWPSVIIWGKVSPGHTTSFVQTSTGYISSAYIAYNGLGVSSSSSNICLLLHCSLLGLIPLLSSHTCLLAVLRQVRPVSSSHPCTGSSLCLGKQFLWHVLMASILHFVRSGFRCLFLCENSLITLLAPCSALLFSTVHFPFNIVYSLLNAYAYSLPPYTKMSALEDRRIRECCLSVCIIS